MIFGPSKKKKENVIKYKGLPRYHMLQALIFFIFDLSCFISNSFTIGNPTEVGRISWLLHLFRPSCQHHNTSIEKNQSK